MYYDLLIMLIAKNKNKNHIYVLILFLTFGTYPGLADMFLTSYYIYIYIEMKYCVVFTRCTLEHVIMK